MQSVNAPSVILCAIALYEDAYIDEWVRYHLEIGFDHIFIYDNSLENTLKALPYAYLGHVTIIHFPGKLRQIPAYTDCVTRLRHTHSWCAFLDIDEFMVLRKHRCVRDLVMDVCPYGGALTLNWVMFGSSGHTQYSSDPVRYRFTFRARGVSEFVKTVAYLPHVARINDCSSVEVFDGAPASVDCHRRPVVGRSNPFGTEDVACIYHYFTKSRAEYVEKMKKGKADAEDFRTVAEFEVHDYMEVEDMTFRPPPIPMAVETTP